MNVYISSTPGYSKECISKLTSLLNGVNGEIRFISGDPFNVDQLSLCGKKFENIDNINSLTFEELFNIARTYRIMKTLQQDDIVVIISTLPHNSNWFSGTSNKNIFVDANGWEYFTDNDSIYSIAYEIVENIFQSLSGIYYNNAKNNPNVHFKSIGCINDMCDNKNEIVLKLRTGYICPSCFKRAQDCNVNPAILLQIHNLIQMIRERLMNFDYLRQMVTPEPTYVDEKCNLHIGNTKIELEYVQQALFIFYLAHLEGIRVDSLEEVNHKKNLLSIYRQLRRGGRKETIDRLCLPYTDPRSTFLKVKSTTNRKIINILGKELSEYYLIDTIKKEDYNIYKIKLAPDYLQFKFELE